MEIGNRLTVVTRSRRLGAPDMEPGALVEPLGAWRGGADFKIDPGYLRATLLRAAELHREAWMRDALSTMVGSYIQAP